MTFRLKCDTCGKYSHHEIVSNAKSGWPIGIVALPCTKPECEGSLTIVEEARHDTL